MGNLSGFNKNLCSFDSVEICGSCRKNACGLFFLAHPVYRLKKLPQRQTCVRPLSFYKFYVNSVLSSQTLRSATSLPFVDRFKAVGQTVGGFDAREGAVIHVVNGAFVRESRIGHVPDHVFRRTLDKLAPSFDLDPE